MEDSKKNGYIAGVIYSFLAAFCIMIAINVGWNLSGQFMGVFGLLFGGLGIGSIWKPESIGQIAAQLLKNMQENAQRQNTTRSKKTQKITQEIHVHGNMSNAIGDSNILNTDSSKKATKKPRKKR